MSGFDENECYGDEHVLQLCGGICVQVFPVLCLSDFRGNVKCNDLLASERIAGNTQCECSRVSS